MEWASWGTLTARLRRIRRKRSSIFFFLLLNCQQHLFIKRGLILPFHKAKAFLKKIDVSFKVRLSVYYKSRQGVCDFFIFKFLNFILLSLYFYLKCWKTKFKTQKMIFFLNCDQLFGCFTYVDVHDFVNIKSFNLCFISKSVSMILNE